MKTTLALIFCVLMSVSVFGQRLPMPDEINTVWFGDGYMIVTMSPGQLPPYTIGISSLEYVDALYVDGTEISFEACVDPLASFIGGMFIGMAVYTLLAMVGVR